MIIEKIGEILRAQAGNDELEVAGSTSLSDLGLDSLDMVEIIMELEDAFSVTISDDLRFETVGDLVKYIEENMA